MRTANKGQINLLEYSFYLLSAIWHDTVGFFTFLRLVSSSSNTWRLWFVSFFPSFIFTEKRFVWDGRSNQHQQNFILGKTSISIQFPVLTEGNNTNCPPGTSLFSCLEMFILFYYILNNSPYCPCAGKHVLSQPLLERKTKLNPRNKHFHNNLRTLSGWALQ